MKNLRKLISEILKEQTSLKEAAYTPENFPPDINIYVSQEPGSFQITPYVTFKDGKKVHAGMLSIIKTKRFGDCHDSYMVFGSISKIKGLGPLLYDIAIDISSHLGGGLMSDRDNVSPDARRVWSFIEKNRSDIIKKQLDNHENELTPYNDDNCDVDVASKGDENWINSPLSKVAYRPGMPVIKKLIEIGKIRFDNQSKTRLGL
jgi:hypothetical protein